MAGFATAATAVDVLVFFESFFFFGALTAGGGPSDESGDESDE